MRILNGFESILFCFEHVLAEIVQIGNGFRYEVPFFIQSFPSITQHAFPICRHLGISFRRYGEYEIEGIVFRLISRILYVGVSNIQVIILCTYVELFGTFNGQCDLIVLGNFKGCYFSFLFL